MKRIFSLLILLVGSVTLAGEPGSHDAIAPPPFAATNGHSAQATVDFLARRLSLTEEQKARILPIIVERRRKVQEVWAASELFVRQKQVQERGINEESDRRIIALLNGDQQKAYAALQQERKVARRLRRAQSPSASN